MNFINNLQIGKRITIGFIMVFMLTGGGTLMVYQNIVQMQQEMTDILEIHNKKLGLVYQIRETSYKRLLNIRSIVLTDDEEEMLAIQGQFNESVRQYAATFEELQKMVNADGGSTSSAEAKGEEQQIIQHIIQVSEENYPVVYAIIQNTIDGFGDESAEDLSKATAFQDQLIYQLERLIRLQKENISTAKEVFYETAKGVYITMAAISVIAILLVTLIWMILSHSIRTPAVFLRNRMHDIMESGDFSLRCNIQQKDEFGEIGRSFNDLLENIQQGLNGVQETMEQVAEGNLEARMEMELTGDLLTLKESINSSVAQMAEMVSNINEVMGRMSEGQFDQQVTTEAKGELSLLKENINTTLSSLHGAIIQIGEVMSALSQGRLDERLEIPLSGDLDTLKTNLNNSLDAMSSILNEAVKVTVAQSEWDLTTEIEGSHAGLFGTLQEASNKSQGDIASMINLLKTSSEQMDQLSRQVNQSAKDLSMRTINQAASLQQTASASDELSSTVAHNATNASKASQFSVQAREAAEHTVSRVSDELALTSDQNRQMIENITNANRDLFSSVSEQNDRISMVMTGITQSSRRISGIISVINDITSKITLLALNASIEAARAGEEGKGFAVVASEVRKLSHRSAKAAKEIGALADESMVHATAATETTSSSMEIIQEIQKKNMALLDTIREDSEQSLNNLNDQVNHDLRSIIDTVIQIGDMVNDIDSASAEQALGIKEVNQAMGELDKLNNQNRDFVEELVSTTISMTENTNSMQQQINQFTIPNEYELGTYPSPSMISNGEPHQPAPLQKENAEEEEDDFLNNMHDDFE